MSESGDELPKSKAAVKTRPLNTKRKIAVPKVVRREARKFLSEGQYLHATDLVKELTSFGQPGMRQDIKVEPFHEFWELKDKGGVLGKINLRVYFGIVEGERIVLVLHADKKEEDGKPGPHVLFLLRQRMRAYLRGELHDGLIRYS